MKYLLIEDEAPAAKRLQRMMHETAPDFEPLGVLESIETSVEWFKANEMPDLCIMDIELADGHSFEIFRKTEITCPVLFTTAFDEYAVKAFRLNSIDYLLKPVKPEELREAIARFRSRKDKPSGTHDAARMTQLVASIQDKKAYQKRILIKFGDTVKALEIADAAYFFTESRVNFMITHDGASYPLDMNLDQLESILDPDHFFRINRQFIVSFKAIKKMTTWSKSRLKLDLIPPTDMETVVSTERSPEFKIWLTGTSDR